MSRNHQDEKTKSGVGRSCPLRSDGPAVNRPGREAGIRVARISGAPEVRHYLVSVPKIAIVVDQLHHSFTKLSVGEADFHALGCAPRA